MLSILGVLSTTAALLLAGSFTWNFAHRDLGRGVHYGSNPMFNKNGDRILVSLQYPQNHKGQLYEIDLEGNIVSVIYQDNSDKSMAAYSPDNSRIVFVKTRDMTQEGSSLWVYETATKTTREIVDKQYLNQLPSFSPDGTRVIFQRAKRLTSGHMGGWAWYDRDVCYFDFTTNSTFRITDRDYYRAGAPKFLGDNRSVIFRLDDQAITSGNSLLFHKSINSPLTQYFDFQVSDFKITRDGSKLFYTKLEYMNEEERKNHPSGFPMIIHDLKTKQEKTIILPISFVDFDISPNETKLILMSFESSGKKSSHDGNFNLYLYDIPTHKIQKLIIKDKGRVVEE